MSKIPTAEEFLKQYYNEGSGAGESEYNNLEGALKEFAKLHVKAALKAKVKAMIKEKEQDSSFSLSELDAFTLDAYPDENVK